MRQCGGCTKCCQGWLLTEIKGHAVSPGNPCPFLDNGCSIYETRPEDPCRRFECRWLTDESVPDWMQPHLSGIILAKREIEGIEYIKAETAADEEISSAVLSWFVIWGLGKNICWTCAGTDHYFGSADFVSAMRSQKAAMLESHGDAESELA